MNMMHHPGARDAMPVQCLTHSGDYELTLRITVEDAGLLWRRAAAHLLTYYAASESLIEETIGPREDPDIADCLALLLGPRPLDGAHVEAISLHSLARPPI